MLLRWVGSIGMGVGPLHVPLQSRWPSFIFEPGGVVAVFAPYQVPTITH
jgi:hypothetical protein